MSNYITVVGLEVHVQLNTLSKAFCADQNQFGVDANTNLSAVTLALPGTLPVANHGHLNAGIKLAHALHSTILPENRFDRKNYSYPDLPKGYQITQDKLPVCVGGELKFISEGIEKTVRIHHAHLEEDAGKNIHDIHTKYSVVDHNRAGTPLIEIVTKPDLRSGQEVHDFISAIQQLVRYLDISDGNMEEGSLRCDVNVSVMPKGSDVYGMRNEIKNVNSKKFARTAVTYESTRQIKLLSQGEKIEQATLMFDPTSGTTSPMRSKEEANDYRYFPDPDLPPITVTPSYINEIIKEVTVLPWTAFENLQTTYQLSEYDAEILSREKEIYHLFTSLVKNSAHYSTTAKLIINKILPALESTDINITSLNKDNLISFVNLLESGQVSKSAALQKMTEKIIVSDYIDVQQLAKDLNLIQSDDQDFLDQIIASVLQDFPDKVAQYKKGKKGLQGFFMGQVMQRAKGKANPQTLNKKLAEALK